MLGFFSTQAVLSKVWVYELESEEVSPGMPQAGGNLSRTHTIPIRTEGFENGSSPPTSEGKAAEESVCFELGDTAPSSKGSL